MAAICHLGFVMRMHGTTHEEYLPWWCLALCKLESAV